MDIAIIGVSCRFPDANTYSEFWNNIVSCHNSVTVTSISRRNVSARQAISEQSSESNELQWGAFLDAVDGFDNQFFGILPKVAETMDPQQRLMLELTWSCLEDAGIPPSTLRGSKVGVVVGVFNNDYKELQENTGNSIEAHHATGTATAIIANRISHFFDFHGPSIPIDAACSSSLNAIHSAIQAITHGDCEIAISGGINLILTPTRHNSFAKMGMLSPTGACHSFDAEADGYVRGEGAGVLLLKPLDKALADGDNIHGVIKGSAINHCGATYTLTYPSADAQADVIIAANQRAGVPINTIGLIEAHGTGTPKGDPIEFAGLVNAFSSLSEQQESPLNSAFCGVTSAKTNIGHLEAAAGVAGVIKVLQAFKHRTLPPLRNFSVLNPRIDASSSPFFFVDKARDWQPVDANTPLRAGVSSFGFGGTNAHVVLEQAPESPVSDSATSSGESLIVLSAKTPAALLQRQKDLAVWLADNTNENVSLRDVSATLLTRREHFNYRYACVVSTVSALVAELAQTIAQGPLDLEQHVADQAEKASAEAATLLNNLDAPELLQQLRVSYLQGAQLPWARLFGTTQPRLISLPTYPFIHNQFWLSKNPNSSAQRTGLPAQLQRVANVGSSRYQLQLQGNEFFFADHQIDGRAILPGVMYLELVRAAAVDALAVDRSRKLTFSQIAWLQPLEQQHAALDIYVQLDPQNDAEHWEFQVLGADRTLYCRGVIALNDNETSAQPVVTHPTLLSELAAEACYQKLDSLQMCYGAGLRAIDQLAISQDACVATLALPYGQAADFAIHPSLADGALQAAVMWVTEMINALPAGDQPQLSSPIIPFALERLEVLGACSANMVATVRLAGENSVLDGRVTLDISVADAANPDAIALKFQGVSLRILDIKNPVAAKPGVQARYPELSQHVAASLYQPHWIEQGVVDADAALEQVLLVGSESDVEQLASQLAQGDPSLQIQRIQFADALDINTPGQARVRAGNSEDFSSAVNALLQQGAKLDRILWAAPAVAADDLTARLQTGPNSLFALTKALMPKVKSARFVHLHIGAQSQADISAFSGFYRTLRVEKPAYIGHVLHCDQALSASALVALLKTEFSDSSKDADVRYQQGRRQVRRFAADAQISESSVAASPLRQQGTYLITGGLGALGLIFARFLCSRYQATVYLSGRSALDEKRQQQLNALEQLGGKVIYVACDTSDREGVNSLIDSIRASGQGLNGIIHSAGVIEDNFILRKTPEAFERVITPKVVGTLLLDEATRDQPLDFFALFSSVTGVLGNIGQCDYAFGNAFEDYFASQRNALQQQGERNGKALSINWPYWKDGGMRLTDKEEAILNRHFGIVPLLTDEGLTIFEYALQRQSAQMVVMPGDALRIADVLSVVDLAPAQPVSAAVASSDAAALQDVVIRYLSELFAKKLQIPPHFERNGFFRDYGFDSVVVIELVNELKKTFGSSLPMTLFFEYQTMEELSGFLLENYDEVCNGLPGAKSVAVVTAPLAATDNLRAVAPQPRQAGAQRIDNNDDIAIIGLAGRYPEADNIEQFWSNLTQGRDSVTDIPAERWDDRWFQEGAATAGKSYSRWGGFLSGVERFDARYFNISPKETEIMDPNEWLFLETVTQAIEDSGYTADKLAPLQAGRENRVGVYVGMMWGDYQMHAVTSNEEQWTTSHSSYWSVANRVSHFYNFSGPSMALDTACSSSLTAIHIACNAIRSGDVAVAVAGGVNLSLHPYKYHLLSNMHFLSTDGRCRSFGEGGSGYVPGEGVGAVILKSLAQAQADGDHIYGVIRGTSINHGGKASGFTVPNAKRQGELVADAFIAAKVNPRHISYVEAHGTGTKLGDPIEISGLNKAFSVAGDNSQYCAIGSVKANIGHLEAAAGMAALTKVLLQMKHQTLVPSIQSKVLNPFIDFQSGPFRVQQSLAPWARPRLDITQADGSVVNQEIPRLSGISSFGAGGSNAHIIVEEYIAPLRSVTDAGKPVLIVLSARREPALRTMAEQLASFIEQQPALSLQDAAYTLQVGRVAHEYRLALVAETAADAINLLRAYAAQQLSGLFTGHRDNVRQATSTPALADWIKQGRLGALGEAWANGHQIDWSQLHAGHARQRLPLPGYAFQRQDFWAPAAPATAGVQGTAVLHPLIDSNISTLAAQAFSKNLRAGEFLLDDHRLGDNRILPGAAYIEMALSASELALQGKALPIAGDKPVLAQVQDVKWRQPISLTGASLAIEIALVPARGGLDFDIYRTDGDKRHSYATGRLTENSTAQPAAIDLQRLLAQGQSHQRSEIDAAFKQRGFSFGPAFQVLERLHFNAEEALAELQFPQSINTSAVVQSFILSPSLLDGAFRTALGIGGLTAEGKVLEVPVALERLQVFKPIDGICYAYARRQSAAANSASYQIDLLDKQGQVVVRIEQLQTQAAPHLGLRSAAATRPAAQAVQAAANSANSLRPVAVAPAVNAPLQPAASSALDAMLSMLIANVIEVTKLDAGEVSAHGQLSDYGLDSMMILALNEKLEAHFDDVSKTLFYEYQDLASLAENLVETYPAQMAAFGAIAAPVAVAVTAPVVIAEQPVSTVAGDDAALAYLIARVIEVTKLDAGDVQPATLLSDYGLDSMMILALNEKLAATFGEVSQTLFYEYQDLASLAEFLGESYPQQVAALQPATAAISAPVQPVAVVAATAPVDKLSVTRDALLASLQAALDAAVSPATPLHQAPLDSINHIQLQHQLDARFDGVSAGDVYLHTTVDAWAAALQSPVAVAAPQVAVSAPVVVAQPKATLAELLNGSRADALRGNNTGAADQQDIAIIGLSGRYPGAKNVDEFWANLSAGVDGVSEIPLSRWDYNEHYSPERGPKDKVYSKWGGFIDDIDQFDSQYFNISPREAELLDPQERLFLQTAWECVSDANYSRQSLSKAPVGVYVGVMWGQYQFIETTDKQHESGWPMALHSSVANRVSFFFNLNGPSVALDTMCSSSLTALHMACQAIHSGDCKMAIAGGVNLIVHPMKYYQLGQSQFLSSDGRCRAFGEGGDGYVPGEGMGAVLLKPLQQAIADGDQIYGVIKATAINHGGKTSGFTVPNQAAQSNVVSTAFQRAGWHPESVNYIEAHGTGTMLGDPIEISGLSKAFARIAAEKGNNALVAGNCRIGSVKSNIGHLESAAGIAGLTKILLQMRHRKMVPSLHSATFNAKINFAASPFRVVRALEDWPSVAGNSRRAGLSAFGAGGSNAHVLIEEAPTLAVSASKIGEPRLFVLSADSEERLSLYVGSMISFLKQATGSVENQLNFEGLAFSSLIGRDALSERLAVVASSAADLLNQLEQYLAEGSARQLSRGRITGSNDRLDTILDGKQLDELVSGLVEQRQLARLARLWTTQLDVNWEQYAKALFAEQPVRRVSFPPMPLITRSHWLEKPTEQSKKGQSKTLHPLLDENTSTLSRQRFAKQFSGREVYLRDHVIDQEQARVILPGSAYLEMLRAAGQLAIEDQWTVGAIRNLMWMTPTEVKGAPVDIAVDLTPLGGDSLSLAVRNLSTDAVAVEAELVYCPADAAIADEWIDLDALRNSGKREDDSAAIYADFAQMGFAYGPSYQVTRERYRFADSALSHLCLPEAYAAAADDFYLHPSLLDGALRTCLAVGLEPSQHVSPIVPFFLGELELRHPLGKECYAYVTPAQSLADGGEQNSNVQKHDITLLDVDGRVLARLKDFAARTLTGESTAPVAAPPQEVQFYGYQWQAAPLPTATASSTAAARVLVLSDNDTLASALRAQYGTAATVISALSAADYAQQDTHNFKVDGQSLASLQALCSQLDAQQMWPTHIVHAWGADARFEQLATAQLQTSLQSLRQLFVALERVKPSQEIRCVSLYQAKRDQVEPQQDAVSGYARSLLTINHRFELFTLRTDADNATALANSLYLEFVQRPAAIAGLELAYWGGQRYQRQLSEIVPPAAAGMGSDAQLPLVRQGHYLITGGAGKLGLLMANYLVARYQARIVLSGRSAQPNAEVQQQITALRAQGAEVRYIAADIALDGQATTLISEAKAAFGDLHGVLHCAGVASATPMTELQDSEFNALIGPKVDGLVALDLATAQEPLSLFVNFSSVSAVLGDLGSGAYAAGNRFMDSHALWRDSLVKQGLRSGQSLSVNWPLWASGQMDIAEDDAQLFEFSGMAALRQEAGLSAFERALLEKRAELLVVVGDRTKIARSLRAQVIEKVKANVAKAKATVAANLAAKGIRRVEPVAVSTDNSGYARTENALKAHISAITKTPAADILLDATFEQLGMDSVMLMELRAVLEKEYEGLSKTAPFEFDTTAKLAGHLYERYDAKRSGQPVVAAPPVIEVAASAPVSAPTVSRPSAPIITRAMASRFAAPVAVAPVDTDAVAVVGLAGEFPGADNLHDFWNSLQTGTENLTAIPEDRWSISGDQPGNPRYVNRGGFLNKANVFDPEMFRMSSDEASRLDPQVRVLLRSAWHALEDAGYTPSALKSQQVGVYVGAMNEDFTWIMSELYARTGKYPGAGSVISELANRISFLLNLRGPSFSVATTCASSLTSVHLARKAILGGECDMALAGGINLSLHPSKYMLLQDMKVLSSDGHEHTFDERANGLIPSEGSGIVVLKRLSKALEDGDHIYGVLRGSSIGHAGTGAGQYLPNLSVMEDTAVRALNEARIDVNQLTYIESHGAATELGDPIELKALSNALRRQTDAQAFCSLGTKANLGHMEAASGVCSLIKVLLSMQHGRLSPCVNLKSVNSSFEQENSPFLFPQQAQDWAPNARGTRVAGINSYGMGGSTAFVVVESPEAEMAQRPAPVVDSAPQIVVLSARRAERLAAYATELRNFVQQQGSQLNLANLAYTSQIGRITLDHRLALVVTSAEDLLTKLTRFIAQPALPFGQGDIYSGNARETNEFSHLIAGEAGNSFISALVQSQQLSRVAALWCRGCEVDWTLLHRDALRQRAAFPGYPFASEPCSLYAALRLDAPRRESKNSELTVLPAAEENPAPSVPQAWFAYALGERQAGDLSAEQLQSFWVGQVHGKGETGSLLSPVLLGREENEDPAEQQLLSVERLLGQDQVAALQFCTQRLGIALETLVVAGWALLANRHVRVNTPQFGLIRTFKDNAARQLQTIPARIQAVGRQKVAPWLSGVEEQLEECLDHVGATLKQIEHWVEGAPLFDSAVAILTDSSNVGLGEASADLFTDHPALHLALLVSVEENSLHLRLDYRGSVAHAAQLNQLLEQLDVLLEGLANNPDKNPAALSMRSKGEGRKALWKTLEKLNQQDQTP